MLLQFIRNLVLDFAFALVLDNALPAHFHVSGADGRKSGITHCIPPRIMAISVPIIATTDAIAAPIDIVRAGWSCNRRMSLLCSLPFAHPSTVNVSKRVYMPRISSRNSCRDCFNCSDNPLICAVITPNNRWSSSPISLSTLSSVIPFSHKHAYEHGDRHQHQRAANPQDRRKVAYRIRFHIFTPVSYAAHSNRKGDTTSTMTIAIKL
jgi:hypothetical protein